MTLKFFRRKSPSKKTDANEATPEPEAQSQKSSGATRAGSRVAGAKRTSSARRSTKDSSANAGGARTSSSADGSRRRSSGRSSSRTKESPEKEGAAVEKAESAAASAKPSTTRSRRGRRGGAGRRSGAEKAATSSADTPGPVEPTPISSRAAPLPAPVTLEALLLRQEAAAEQQLLALKGLQGSLSAIENRLSRMDGLGAGGDRPRIGVFVDVPNVIYAAERQKAKLDYKKLLEFLVHGRELVRASAYAPISDDTQMRLESQRFVEPFVDIGYSVITKPHKRYADGSMKANFDVELAIDVLTMSDRLDIVILVSGDGDFRRLVEIVASKGVRVEVVAFSQSTAAELRAVADLYINLNDHVAELRVD